MRRLVDEADGAIVVAHPYRYFPSNVDPEDPAYYPTLAYACEDPVFAVADAVEVANGRATAQQNAFSREIGHRLGLPGCGGSDAHKLSDIGASAPWFENKVTSLEQFIAELKGGRFRPALRSGGKGESTRLS